MVGEGWGIFLSDTVQLWLFEGASMPGTAETSWMNTASLKGIG